MRAGSTEIATALARIAGADNDAPAARSDQTGASKHAGCHAASTRTRQNVTTLPHEACTRSSGVLEDAFGGAEVCARFWLANATEFWLEVVGWHEGAPKMRGDVEVNVSRRKEFKMRRRNRSLSAA